MLVKLSDFEISIASFVAAGRQRVARDNGVIDKKVCNQDNLQVDIDGMIGELAFGKAFNLWPDLDVRPQSGTYDFLSKQGSKIDVKSTRHKTGKLLVNVKKKPDSADIYVLAVIDGNKVNIAGYMKTEEIMSDKYLTDLGYGPVYAADQANLNKF